MINSLNNNSGSNFNLEPEYNRNFNLGNDNPGDCNLKDNAARLSKLESNKPGKEDSGDFKIRQLEILDLFSGSGAWVEGWRRNTTYHTNIDSVDIIEKPHINFCMDVRDFKITKQYDIVYASPPCIHFSQMRNINKCKTTKEQFTEALQLATLSFEYGKRAKLCYVIENPYTGKLKNYFPNYQITDYSEYNFPMRKRTAIWSNIDLKLKRRKNGDVNYNTIPLQYLKPDIKSRIPTLLSNHIKWMIIKKFTNELKIYRKIK